MTINIYNLYDPVHLYDKKVPNFVIAGEGKYYRNIKITLNANLKKWKFYKVFSPFNAYQEISMFLGNDLVRERQGKVPTGDDVTLAKTKGFDKYSFRKEKSEKK